MDSALAPLMAEESARPYFAYSPLYPAERAFTCMFAEIQKGDVLMPSSLLTFTSPQIRLHFQYGPDDRLSSPQVPAGNMRDLAESRYLAPELIDQATRRLNELGKTRQPQGFGRRARCRGTGDFGQHQLHAGYWTGVAIKKFERIHDAVSEHEARPEFTIRTGFADVGAIDRASRAAPGRLDRPALVLARRVRVEEGTFLQGCWLDWDVIRRDLVTSVADLLPNASLDLSLPTRRAVWCRHGCWPRYRPGWCWAQPPTSRSHSGHPSGSRSGLPGRASHWQPCRSGWYSVARFR